MTNMPEDFLARLRVGEHPSEVLSDFLDRYPIEDTCSNLGHLCRAGIPDPDEDPEVSVVTVEIDGELCRVQIQVYFSEVTNLGGCPDMPNLEPRAGKAHFIIDLCSGLLTWREPEARSPGLDAESQWQL